MKTSRRKALWLTARPKTLSAAIVPVLVATALVASEGLPVTLWISILAVTSAVFIQIGTNFANDALDFVKGTDDDDRLGDLRACHQGWFTPNQILWMAGGFFLLAFLCGIPLVMVGGVPIIWIGLVSLLMGYAYTGGPFPLAYIGLGDLFVILFFGLVAVGGVYFLQTGQYQLSAFIAGLQVGLLATVLIAINNLRDLDQDRASRKMTLAVRLGPKLGRFEVLLLILLAFGLNVYWLNQGFYLAFFLPLVALPPALGVVRTLINTPASREYNRLLAKASFVHMLFGVLLSVGFLV